MAIPEHTFFGLVDATRIPIQDPIMVCSRAANPLLLPFYFGMMVVAPRITSSGPRAGGGPCTVG